ncbi:TasA family protein [Nocardioides jensenii]|uniref:TasA family protein n=1 Tax=Nocardioides jensenii TaxID=1843 RepID=UPI000831DC30|nr:TasA family protein [Nocardioides jensenii]
MRSNKSGRKNSVKLLASAALVVAAAGVAGLGTYGSFTSSTAASTNVGSGTVKLDMSNQATRGLDVAVTNMVPADTAQRAVQLTRSATSEAFGALTLKTTMTTDNLLKTGADGLKLQIDACSSPWTKAATTNDLTCTGTTTSVLAAGSALQTNVALPQALTDLNGAAKVSNLRIQLSLPLAADNTYQTLSNAVNFEFTATQRAGEAR